MPIGNLKLRQLAAAVVAASLICVTGLLVASAQHGVPFPFTWTADYNQAQYGITLDAGSHGTRAHLYRWSGRIEDPNYPLKSPITIPVEIGTVTAAVGIAQLFESPAELESRVLAPLIHGLKSSLKDHQIAKTDWNDIPIYLKATAGMRNLDVDQRDGVMTNIRKWLSNSTNNPFYFKEEWARVISGEEEGTFGWISVNNQAGTLTNAANDTIGSLDLGGASAQMTFKPVHTSVLEDFYELNLGPFQLRLYSHSYLGYGWGDAFSRLTTRLALESIFSAFKENRVITSTPMKDANPADEVFNGSVPHIIILPNQPEKPPFAKVKADHPCFPKGVKLSFTLPPLVYPDGRSFLDLDLRAVISYLRATGLDITSPAIASQFPPKVIQALLQSPLNTNPITPINDQVVVPINAVQFSSNNASYALQEDRLQPFKPFSVPLPRAQLRYEVSFSGSGDFYQCQLRANELFYNEPCFLGTCSFNGIYQPRIAESEFLALGQFSKIRSAFGIPPTSTPDTLEMAVSNFCGKHWSEIKRLHGLGNFYPFNKRGLTKLCWKGVWAHAILTTGFGLDGQSRAVTYWVPPDVSAADELMSPSWALGSMVAEISTYPWQNTRGRFKAPYYWALASIVCLLTLTFIQERRILNLRDKLNFFHVRRSDVYEDIHRSPSP